MGNTIDVLNQYYDDGCTIRGIEVTSGKHVRIFIGCEDGSLPTLTAPESDLEEIQNWLNDKSPGIEIKTTE